MHCITFYLFYFYFSHMPAVVCRVLCFCRSRLDFVSSFVLLGLKTLPRHLYPPYQCFLHTFVLFFLLFIEDALGP
jgi:hypothetical protein